MAHTYRAHTAIRGVGRLSLVRANHASCNYASASIYPVQMSPSPISINARFAEYGLAASLSQPSRHPWTMIDMLRPTATSVFRRKHLLAYQIPSGRPHLSLGLSQSFFTSLWSVTSQAACNQTPRLVQAQEMRRGPRLRERPREGTCGSTSSVTSVSIPSTFAWCWTVETRLVAMATGDDEGLIRRMHEVLAHRNRPSPVP